jgi:hypothetical protein
MRQSYLNEKIKATSGGPSTAEQLAEIEKRGRGNSSFAQFLRDQRTAELAAEQQTADRVASLEKMLNADAIESERLRVQVILTCPEEDANAIRLNGYAQKVHEAVDMTKEHLQAEWEAWSTPAIQMAQDFIKITKKQEPMNPEEINQVLRYLVTNQLFIGDHQSWISGFSNLINHGVIRVPVPIAEVVAAPTPGRYDSVQQEIDSLNKRALELPYGSRDRENLERAAYKMALQLETVGNGRHADILQEIVDATGLTLSSENNLRFQTWLEGPMQARRFDGSRASVRLAFAEYFGNTSFLSDSERELIGYNRSVEGMTSDDIKRSVGTRNTYDPSNDAYRAGRS